MYKLTVKDGIGERTIVSPLVREYAPNELIGKNVVVLINLPPQKFGNCISNGMLLTAINENNTRHIVFVDEYSQIGTQIKL